MGLQSNFAMDRMRRRDPETGVCVRLAHPLSGQIACVCGCHQQRRLAVKPDSRETRNPFNVMDVPTPNDDTVTDFAAGAMLAGDDDDANARAWSASGGAESNGLDGPWSSRWNGGADPTIPGDAADTWKQGPAEVKMVDDRIYLFFTWDGGARKGLIDAQSDGVRLTGKYINLTDPAITRPWIGLIVNTQRIDGRWTGGRLDFRR
jgi:hypothetical protein